MKKQKAHTVEDHIATIDLDSLGSVEGMICRLQDVLDCFQEAHSNINLRWSDEAYTCGETSEIYVMGTRDETEAEKNKRLGREFSMRESNLATLKKTKARLERELVRLEKKLKKEFGGD